MNLTLENKLLVNAVVLEIKESSEGNFELHGFSVDEDRTHFIFGRIGLKKIGKWLIAFADQNKIGDALDHHDDPREWEIIVTGPPS